MALHFLIEAVKDFVTVMSLLLPGVCNAIIRRGEIEIPRTK